MNPLGSSFRHNQLKGLLVKGLSASRDALEKMAPHATSLAELSSNPEQDIKLKTGLLWAATRAPAPLDSCLNAWTWLESKGLSVPQACAPQVLPSILDQQDLGLCDWLEKRWGPLDSDLWGVSPKIAWAHAVRRTDMAALDRLFQIAPLPAYDPAQIGLSLAPFAVTWHKDAALPYLLWLRDHGVDLCPAPDQSPLLRAASQFRDRAGAGGGSPDPARVAQLEKKYMAIWDLLVEAGVDPHAPIPQGPSAYDTLMDSPARGVLLARQREQHAGHGPSVHRQRPPRVRA